MLHRHCVSLALYERKCADYAELFEKYHALKLAGAAPPPEPKPSRIIPAAPSAEEQAHARLIADIVESGAKELAVARGISLDAARQEMQRIRGEALGGSVMDPPV